MSILPNKTRENLAEHNFERTSKHTELDINIQLSLAKKSNHYLSILPQQILNITMNYIDMQSVSFHMFVSQLSNPIMHCTAIVKSSPEVKLSEWETELMLQGSPFNS